MELDASMLQPIVGYALDALAVPVEWSVVPILAGDGQGLGVFRVSGSARVGGEPRGWSVILKVLSATPWSPTRWNYPAREALAYERGLLEDLPPGLEAPRCFGHTEPDGQHHLWLEDLGSDAMRWRLGDYGRAARALGRFNGAYLTGRPLPMAGWLSRQWLRSWLAEGAAAVRELRRFQWHPLVQRVYPPEVLDRLLRLWAHRQELLDALDRLPQGWVGPQRPARIAPGGFLRPARRTRRAAFNAPGSPRVLAAGQPAVPTVGVGVHGDAMVLPR